MRSVVRVYPGPPAFWNFASRSHPRLDAKGPKNGAIAQLGERLLCKQDVVGSIPSGSTNFVAGLPIRQIDQSSGLIEGKKAMRAMLEWHAQTVRTLANSAPLRRKQESKFGCVDALGRP